MMGTLDKWKENAREIMRKQRIKENEFMYGIVVSENINLILAKEKELGASVIRNVIHPICITQLSNKIMKSVPSFRNLK